MQNNLSNNAENFNQPEIEKHPAIENNGVPTPDNPPWNSWTALGAWIASVILIAVFPLLFLLPYLSQQNLSIGNQDAVATFFKTDPTAVLLQVLSVFPAHLLTLLMAWLIVTRGRKYSFKQTLGWEWNGFKIWHSILIVIGFFLLGIVLVKTFGEPENDFSQMLKISRSVVIAVAILATFTAPIVEEVIYRGILYSAFQRSIGVVWGVALVTFLFALVHVPQYSKNLVPDFQTVGMLLLLSLTLTLIRVFTKNLLPCILLHTIFNGIQAVGLILEPYLQSVADKNGSTATILFRFFQYISSLI